MPDVRWSMFASNHARFDVVLCDIDGCLADEGPAPLDLAALAKVAAHNDRAMRDRDAALITVCTGRPQPFAEAICRLIHNTALECVAENGAWLYHPGTNHYEMDPEITPDHLRQVREAAAWLHETFGPQGVSQQPGKTAAVSLYHDDTPFLMEEVLPRVTEGLRRRGLTLRVSRTERYINCDLPHVSKGSALDRLLARHGLKRDRLAGIGDSMSDIAIRERVAFFACPANAIAEVKSAADFVSDRTQAEGVLDILREIESPSKA